MNRKRSHPLKVRRLTILVALLATAGVVLFLFLRLRKTDLTLAFTREDLQQRVAEKFPFDQKLLFVTVVYSNPVIKLDEGSDRIGIGLDVTAELAGHRLVKGIVKGDWEVRYEATEGALYFDDPNISQFDIQGLPAATQDVVSHVAKPVLKEYLRRVPVYRFKPGDLGRDFARTVLKSVTAKKGRLVIVLGSN